ncbi:hypothetical protein AAF712_015755 [Marasmius tenuissimus]|uniref:Ubiquitin-like protease family profile domain-containing protein n=1 Tax=Marasmius tenuissimus TaxID=585030 RepID=A0ABR2Z8M4_9AGAR
MATSSPPRNPKRTLLGHADPSPQRKRAKKDRKYVNLSSQSSRRDALQRKFELMRGRIGQDTPASTHHETSPAPVPSDLPTNKAEESHVDQDLTSEPSYAYGDMDDALPPPSACSTTRPSKRDEEEARVRRWKEVLKTLVDPLLGYWDSTMGVYPEKVVRPSENHCRTGTCVVEVATVQIIHFDHHRTKLIRYCRCQSLPQVLVMHGLFPTSPSQPRMAVSMELLELYRALCQQSSDAITALAAGLTTVYQRRGFRLVNGKGEALQDPICQALGHSLEWYDTLLVEVDRYLTRKVELVKQTLPVLQDAVPSLPSPLALSTAFTLLPSSSVPVSTASADPPVASTASADPPAASTTSTDPPAPAFDPTADSKSQPSPTSTAHEAPPASTGTRAPTPPSTGSCDPYLQRLCPACFGEDRFGQSFQWGGDIHVALDGNLHHRHLKSGGDGAPFHTSTRILSKEFVDSVGERITAARARPPKHYSPKVPDDVVDSDRDSYKAASGDTEKKSNESFDENGVMALVCRHDIPLFIASIDTPAEQQKHAVALLVALFQMLPALATVVALYDIACVLDRSIHIYDLLDDDIVARLQLATAVMHAYSHQWVCQLHYNPRMRVGLGITDGEGTERLWSRLCKMIGLERRASRARRVWMIDRQCDAIALDLREGIGKWITKRLQKNVQKKEADAVKELRKLGTTQGVLRRYWSEQKEAQSSACALAPARVKKELSKVFQLHDRIDDLEEEITSVKSAVKRLPFPPADAIFRLRTLEELHQKLKLEAEGLYTTLNIDQQFPELKGIPLEYLHTLILARDLKLTIRRKAIGSFFEWDRLDQAIGGVHEALGTRAHQLTRKSISRRTDAFENLIRKFNQYITYLEKHHQPSYRIPVPSKLPTQLAALRDMETSHLWEDVWIAQSDTPPKWLNDEGVRKGMRSLLLLDRCAEERARLETEAKNLCLWFRRELQALMFMKGDVRSPTTSVAIFPDAGSRNETNEGIEGEGSDEDDEDEITEIRLALGDVMDESELEDVEDAIPLRWEVPSSLLVDATLLAGIKGHPFPRFDHSSYAPRSILQYSFKAPQYERLDSAAKWLDDECINGCAALLQKTMRVANVECAVLSSFIVSEVLNPGSHCTETAWRLVRLTEYWARGTWIIPIHDRTGCHWALAVIRVEKEEVLLFDSFGSQSFIGSWLPKIQVVVSRLVAMAKDHGFVPSYKALSELSSWTARLLQMIRAQHNGYDCGVWVLWIVAVVIRGFDYAHIEEKDIPRFHKYLANLVRTIPVS